MPCPGSSCLLTKRHAGFNIARLGCHCMKGEQRRTTRHEVTHAGKEHDHTAGGRRAIDDLRGVEARTSTGSTAIGHDDLLSHVA